MHCSLCGQIIKSKLGYLRVCKICYPKLMQYYKNYYSEHYPKSIIAYTCVICGKKFSHRYRNKARKLKTCSKECLNKLQRSHMHNYKPLRNYSKEERIKALTHYGGNPPKCVCCGESHLKFLTIDHINGGGNKHRKKVGSYICAWLIKNNFPEDFQVLCYNCNCGRSLNNGICPHKE